MIWLLVLPGGQVKAWSESEIPGFESFDLPEPVPEAGQDVYLAAGGYSYMARDLPQA